MNESTPTRPTVEKLPIVAYGYENTRPSEKRALMMVKLENASDQYPELAVPLVRLSDAQAAIHAAAPLASSPYAGGWRTIDSAPKDSDKSTPFLVLRRGIVVQVSWFEGRLYPDARESCVDYADGITDATHWMPLPSPPGAEK